MAQLNCNPLKKTLIACGILYLVDAFVLSQGIFSVVIAVCAVIALVVGGAWELVRRRPPDWTLRAKKTAIYIAMAVCVVGTIALQNHMAERRTLRLADACTAYKAKHQKYPERLSQLVPEFMPSIPPAKYTLMVSWAGFYYSGGSSPFIMYTAMPPFGRRLYYVEHKKWGYMD